MIETQAACTRIVVLGDTHGQLGDVLWAISKFGMPNERNVYVVNGDIASRRKFGKLCWNMLEPR